MQTLGSELCRVLNDIGTTQMEANGSLCGMLVADLTVNALYECTLYISPDRKIEPSLEVGRKGHRKEHRKDAWKLQTPAVKERENGGRPQTGRISYRISHEHCNIRIFIIVA